MLNFFKTKVLLDLDICDDFPEYVTTSFPHTSYGKMYDIVNARLTRVKEFDGYRVRTKDFPKVICMTISELYAFCKDWYRNCSLNIEDFNFDQWFLDYLNCYTKTLNAENTDSDWFTYYDAMKLKGVTEAIKSKSYKTGINPMKCMPLACPPDISWVIEDFLDWKYKRNRRFVRYHDLEKYVQRNIADMVHHVSMYNAVVKGVVTLPIRTHKKDGSLIGLDGINLLDQNAILYFQNPFNSSDFETNFVAIQRALNKYRARVQR